MKDLVSYFIGLIYPSFKNTEENLFYDDKTAEQ
jgi:hypothetical protein